MSGSLRKESLTFQTIDTQKQEEYMNSDMIINDHYHTQGAYEIEIRVRNRQRQNMLEINEEELEKSRRQIKNIRLFNHVLLNVLFRSFGI